MSENSDGISPLRYTLAPSANAELENISDWLTGISTDAAQRFIEKFNEEIRTLCLHLAEQIAAGRPAGQIDDAASIAFSQPVYSRLFTTQKKRTRRSSVGIWRISYTLIDANKDNTVDTLRVLAVRHGASRPIWDIDDTPIMENSDKGE